MYEIKATAALGVLRTVVQLMCTVGMKVRTLEAEHLSFFQFCDVKATAALGVLRTVVILMCTVGMKLRTVEAEHLSFFQFCDV